MKIALFTPYLPYPPDTGGKIRSYHLFRALTTRFEVDLYTVYYGDKPSEEAVNALRKHCRQVVPFRLEETWRLRDRIRHMLSPLPRSVRYFHNLRSLEQARRHLRDDKYDLVIADEICMTPYSELAPDLPRVTIRHKVDYMHYTETARARPLGLEKVLDFIEAVKLRQYEQMKMPFYQAGVACSESDATLIQHEAPGVPILVIPNGVDLDAFGSSGQSNSENLTLLYVGSMHYYPNVDAVQFFFKTMYEPIRQEVPNLRIQIVGHTPPIAIQQLAQLPGVEVTGTVPDVRLYYEQATVFIVPLRLGGGTRLKILEAMAMGLPVVSTSVGAEGLDVRPGEDILIADDPASFTTSVLRLLSEPELRHRLAEGGRLLAQRYDWKVLTKLYLDLVEMVARQWRQKGSEANRPLG